MYPTFPYITFIYASTYLTPNLLYLFINLPTSIITYLWPQQPTYLSPQLNISLSLSLSINLHPSLYNNLLTCISTYLSINQISYLLTYLSIDLPACICTYLSINLTNLFINLLTSLPTHLSINMSTYLCTYCPIDLHTHLPIHQPIHQPTYPFRSLSTFLVPSACKSWLSGRPQFGPRSSPWGPHHLWSDLSAGFLPGCPTPSFHWSVCRCIGAAAVRESHRKSSY